MRWTAAMSKIVVAAAAGAFLAVSAVRAEPPRPASDSDPFREERVGSQQATPTGRPATSPAASPSTTRPGNAPSPLSGQPSTAASPSASSRR